MSLAATSDVLNIIIQLAVLTGLIVTIAIQLNVRKNVRKVEIATNSMKDALVAATDKAAGLAGEARGRAQEKADPSAR